MPPGTWTASEVFPLPATWALTNLVCVDPTNNTTVNVGDRHSYHQPGFCRNRDVHIYEYT